MKCMTAMPQRMGRSIENALRGKVHSFFFLKIDLDSFKMYIVHSREINLNFF